MGWENISVQLLSAHLKMRDHECELAYDQCLFDDKNYVHIGPLQRLFNNSSAVIEQVVRSDPDLICFSVMSVMVSWANNLAQVLKEELPHVPIVFGGYHPTGTPETVMLESFVDYVVVGEGEHALAQLCDALEDGTTPVDIPGVWYRDENGAIVDKGRAQPVEMLDELPYVDKSIFENHVPLHTYYLSSLARGCIYDCSYCAVSLFNEFSRDSGLKQFRYFSPERAVDELKCHAEHYGSKWIDFRHAIFAVNQDWIEAFCQSYKDKIGVPFRVFMHPSVVKEKAARTLKDAGCFTIQMGLESFDQNLRREALNRNETNKTIMRAIDTMEEVGIPYTLDYILGLPGQTETELENVLEMFSRLKHCYRLSPFMCQYLPGSKMVDYAVRRGDLSLGDVERINSGEHDNYMGEGSIGIYSGEWQRKLRMYRLIFRSFGLVPAWARQAFLKSGIYRVFQYLPQKPTLKILDIFIALFDMDARSYFYNYLWWISRRFVPGHPTFIFRRSPLRTKYRSLNLLAENAELNRFRCRGEQPETAPQERLVPQSNREGAA